MQTSKARNGPSEGPQKTSSVTSRSSRMTKSGGTEADSSTAKLSLTKTPTDRSPKVLERRSPKSSPRSPAEKRRPSRLSELESQLPQLQEDLKKTKDQLSSSEASKKQAQQEAEDFKKQLLAMTEKLEDSKNQLVEFSAVEEARLQELRKISQDRDRAWQSELEAIQKQHSVDSAALTSAMNEIHRLKVQLDMVLKSEADQANHTDEAQTELQALKQDLADTLSIVENLKTELYNSEKAEAEAEAKVVETQQQLEVAKLTVETLRSEGMKLMELFKSSISELEESRARVSSLEETLKKLQEDQLLAGGSSPPHSLDSEVERLKSALQAAEITYEEEQTRITTQIRSAYEMVESVKIESELRQSELESALKNAMDELAELKTSLLDKETELQSLSDMNADLEEKLGTGQLKQVEPELESKLTKSVADVAELKANLMDKENELQSISEENEQLKLEMGKKEVENTKSYEAAITEMELAKAKEKEAVMKLGYVTEEADKSSQRAVRMSEQLEAAQTVNSEMEAELRRLRVQSDQWRKAAEAAAAVLTTGNNGRHVDRSSSLDAEYQSVAGKLMNSPFSDDLDDDSPKKKNNNVLRKFGGLWKKGPK
ncbi:interactor of constitutive active ROPs 2, chloroplastic-like isoform X3 [Iris pallida]|uniref:Interactor of constitutive active ROPs 2, chloroplastic-like isoform X3 n=2 Tax=Iris pallida TaxID=29817 RepID=A0AAX6G9P2_IRIPA|nr:interactor of constitutive active ROPs 2, chloroplastic-like isoform X3 [Iris pallida]